MNTELTAKLDKIKAALRAWIAADKERTQEPWIARPYNETSEHWRVDMVDGGVVVDMDRSKDGCAEYRARAGRDARFIAIASAMSRPTAEALLVAIEGVGECCDNQCATPLFLERLITAWPDKSL